MSFPKETVEDALVSSGRSCCICHKFCGVRIEMHHLKPQNKGGDDSLENCIPLCFDCHAEVEHYNNSHPRGRKFSEAELRKHRDNWYRTLQESNNPAPPCDDPAQIVQLVAGQGNMVAGHDMNIHTERIRVINKTVVHTDPGGKHISNSTARKIQELVKDIIEVYAAAGKEPKGIAPSIWSRLYKQFNVTTYKEIALDDSEKAIQWLHAQAAMARPKIRRKAPEKWKQSLYKPIYTRATKELNMSKEQLYALAQERLQLAKPITSLKELTERNLERLHHIMFYEVNKLTSSS